MKHQPQGKFAQRALSIVSASALALTGLFALGGTAASAVSAGDIVPPAGGGSITVHKHSSNPSGEGTGLEIADPTSLGNPIGDIPFKLDRVTYQGVPINLSTAEGWSHVTDGMTAADITGDYGLTPVVASQLTGSDGITTFSGLDLGLYVVTELPNSVVAATDMAPAFLVSVPHRSATQDTWNYNVHVYPKNKLPDVPTKEVSDPTGDLVNWTITFTVPRPAAGHEFATDLTLTDQLDTRLEYQSATVTRNGTAIDPSITEVDGLVTVTIPKADLVVGDTYVVVLTTKVLAEGEIPNTAFRNVDGSSVETNAVQTNWGAVKVIKLEDGTNVTLDGAKFEVWNADKTELLLAEQTTGPNGEITFDKLWLGNGTDTQEEVCLKETQPPAGHSLPATGEWTCLTLDADGTGIVEQTVYNPKRTTPALPLTGSTGTAMFTAGGAALLLMAAGAALVASRKRRESLTK